MNAERCEWTTKDTTPNKGVQYSTCGMTRSPVGKEELGEFELCPNCNKLITVVPWALIEEEMRNLRSEEFAAAEEAERRAALNRLQREQEDRKKTEVIEDIKTALCSSITAHPWRVVLGHDDLFHCERCGEITRAYIDDISKCDHMWTYTSPIGDHRTCHKCKLTEPVAFSGEIVQAVRDEEAEITRNLLVVHRWKSGISFSDRAAWDAQRLNKELEDMMTMDPIPVLNTQPIVYDTITTDHT